MRRAFSLAEAVLGVFLMLVGILLIGNLFLVGLRYSARIERRLQANLAAETRLADLRAQAALPAGFLGLGALDGQVTRAEGLSTHLVVRPHRLRSPAWPLEADQPAGQQRELATSAWQVGVAVYSDGQSSPLAHLWSLVAAPVRPIDPVTLLEITPESPPPALVPQDGLVHFRVAARDSEGNLIPDLFFAWYVLSKGGNGSISAQDRDGRRATFKHQVVLRRPGGPPSILHVGGPVEVRVRAVYAGREVITGFPLELAP